MAGFSPDGTRLASAGADDTVRVWDATTGRQQAQPTGHTSQVRSVAFSPDGRTLASGSGDGTVRLWDASGLATVRRDVVRIACEQSGGLDQQTWDHYVPSVPFLDPCHSGR